MKLLQGDCLERMKEIPDGSVDLVLCDPPYNVSVKTQVNNRDILNTWDKWTDREAYYGWMLAWMDAAHRVLKDNGVLYFWHNDFEQMAEIQHRIAAAEQFAFNSFCIWDKGKTFRAQTWLNRAADGKTALRSWFNRCEYCLEYFVIKGDSTKAWNTTGLQRINSNPKCYRPLKEWYQSELKRLGITGKDMERKYTEVTGRAPHMFRHYFYDSQFEIPTRKVWESVFQPMGFSREYEDLRREYEDLRHYHVCDAEHSNVWQVPPISSYKRFHTCQKPVELLMQIIRTSCREGGVVLDPTMGSGSTGVACVNTGREFIGIELDKHYFNIAEKRITEAQAQQKLPLAE